MNNAELIKALRKVANWIVAMSYNSEYAHDELKMLHYEDSIRAAADALKAADKRIAALKADKKTLINVVKDKSDFHATKDAMRIAELEARLPKEGEWIKKDSWYYCSCCGHEMFFTGTFDEEQRFCYYCGARMRGEHDGSH